MEFIEYLEKPLQCPSCNVVYANAEDLNRHAIEQHQSKAAVYSCTDTLQIVSKYWPADTSTRPVSPYSVGLLQSPQSPSMLATQHTQIYVHWEKPLQCPFCNVVYANAEDLNQHAIEQHQSKAAVYSCTDTWQIVSKYGPVVTTFRRSLKGMTGSIPSPVSPYSAGSLLSPPSPAQIVSKYGSADMRTRSSLNRMAGWLMSPVSPYSTESLQSPPSPSILASPKKKRTTGCIQIPVISSAGSVQTTTSTSILTTQNVSSFMSSCSWIQSPVSSSSAASVQSATSTSTLTTQNTSKYEPTEDNWWPIPESPEIIILPSILCMLYETSSSTFDTDAKQNSVKNKRKIENKETSLEDKRCRIIEETTQHSFSETTDTSSDVSSDPSSSSLSIPNDIDTSEMTTCHVNASRQGGVYRFPDCDIEVLVQENAVDSPTSLRVIQHKADVQDNSTASHTYEFLPHGCKFDFPILVKIPLILMHQYNVNALKVWYSDTDCYNESNWVDLSQNVNSKLHDLPRANLHCKYGIHWFFWQGYCYLSMNHFCRLKVVHRELGVKTKAVSLTALLFAKYFKQDDTIKMVLTYRCDKMHDNSKIQEIQEEMGVYVDNQPLFVYQNGSDIKISWKVHHSGDKLWNSTATEEERDKNQLLTLCKLPTLPSEQFSLDTGGQSIHSIKVTLSQRIEGQDRKYQSLTWILEKPLKREQVKLTTSSIQKNKSSPKAVETDPSNRDSRSISTNFVRNMYNSDTSLEEACEQSDNSVQKRKSLKRKFNSSQSIHRTHKNNRQCFSTPVITSDDASNSSSEIDNIDDQKNSCPTTDVENEDIPPEEILTDAAQLTSDTKNQHMLPYYSGNSNQIDDNFSMWNSPNLKKRNFFANYNISINNYTTQTSNNNNLAIEDESWPKGFDKDFRDYLLPVFNILNEDIDRLTEIAKTVAIDNSNGFNAEFFFQAWYLQKVSKQKKDHLEIWKKLKDVFSENEWEEAVNELIVAMEKQLLKKHISSFSKTRRCEDVCQTLFSNDILSESQFSEVSDKRGCDKMHFVICDVLLRADSEEFNIFKKALSNTNNNALLNLIKV